MIEELLICQTRVIMNNDFLNEIIATIKQLNVNSKLEKEMTAKITAEFEREGTVSTQTLNKMFEYAIEFGSIPVNIDPQQFQVETIQSLDREAAIKISRRITQLADKQLHYLANANNNLSNQLRITNYNLSVLKHNEEYYRNRETLQNLTREYKNLKLIKEAEEEKFFLFRNKKFIEQLEDKMEEIKSKHNKHKEIEVKLNGLKQYKTQESLASQGQTRQLSTEDRKS